MDHLPTVAGREHIKVPCLAPDGYDGGEFFSYPGRQGWPMEQLNALIHGTYEEATPGDAARFLQAWYYFGLLHEFFHRKLGSAFDQKDYIDGQFVTTRTLGGHLRAWASIYREASDDEKKLTFERLKGLFRFIWQATNRFCSYSKQERDESPKLYPVPPVVALSMKILADTLQHAAFKTLGLPFNTNYGYSRWLWDTMEQSGWCKSTLHILVQGQTLQLMYYASTMEDPHGSSDHISCSEAMFKLEQVDAATYKPMHQTPCTDCEFLGPSMPIMKAIIDAGEFPVMKYERSGAAGDLIVKSSAELPAETSFTAISHVWVQGLGNIERNELPRCQFEWIQERIDWLSGSSSVAGDSFWWCDTLCVPTKVHQPQFNKALNSMAKLYSTAEKILAIDQGLTKISVQTSPAEIFLRLRSSPWMRRLWTFQEARLAKQLFFLFKDGVRFFQDIAALVNQESLVGEQYLFRRYEHLWNITFRAFAKNSDLDATERLLQIWKELKHRRASVQSDEAVVVATLLGRQIETITAISEDQHERRMVKIFSEMKQVPLSLMFQQRSHIRIPGFRWAPYSLLDCFRLRASDPGRVPGYGDIHSEQGGLVCEFPLAIKIDVESPVSLESLLRTYFALDDGPAFYEGQWPERHPDFVLTYVFGNSHIPKDLPQQPLLKCPLIIVNHSRDSMTQPTKPAIVMDLHSNENEQESDYLDADYIEMLFFHMIQKNSAPGLRPTSKNAYKFAVNEKKWRIY